MRGRGEGKRSGGKKGVGLGGERGKTGNIPRADVNSEDRERSPIPEDSELHFRMPFT